ncbi:MAG: hypothetical protein WCA39_04015 [Nitrososphaeraceae archaeon]
MNKKDLVTIIFIVVMVFVVGVFVGDYLWRVEYAAELIRKGCSPTAFDRNGIPTKWRCPAAVIR